MTVMAYSIRHNYRAIFTYDPVTNSIGACKFLGESYLFRGDLLSAVFTKILSKCDLSKEIVIGASLMNTFYQISATRTGYVKEDEYTVDRLNRDKILTALSKEAKQQKVVLDF